MLERLLNRAPPVSRGIAVDLDTSPCQCFGMDDPLLRRLSCRLCFPGLYPPEPVASSQYDSDNSVSPNARGWETGAEKLPLV